MTYRIRSEAHDVQDNVTYRCVNGACARALPRRVNFCPFCGTSQRTGLPRPSDVVATAPVVLVKPVTPQPALVATAVAPATAPQPPAAAAAAAAAEVSLPRAAAPARPPQREPVRLRYWLLALGLLWLIWITQRPTAVKIDARIDNAIALANACKAVEAQGELIALNDGSATPAQLQRLQAALNRADAACERKRARSRAAPKPARPFANERAESARNLLADARQALAMGDYRSASDKMETCLAMVDAGSRECGALKAKADRLQGEMQRCLAAGREWMAERCQ
jgi:hypothetical protein